MTKEVQAIPERYRTLTPYVIVTDASRAIDFYERAFDAVEIERHTNESGRTSHAEVRIGDSILMMSEEYEFRGVLARSAKTVGATTAHVYLYTDDAQTMVAKAVAAGATLVVPVQKQYWGDRMGGVADPFGHVWWIATHEEDLSDAEVQERFRAAARATRPSVA